MSLAKKAMNVVRYENTPHYQQLQNDPQYQQLVQNYNTENETYEDARSKLDPDLLSKSHNAVARGALGGMAVGGLGGAGGMGTLGWAMSRADGRGVIRRGLSAAGHGMLGGMGGLFMGGLGGLMIGGKMSDHYDHKQDPAALKHYRQQADKRDDAAYALDDYDQGLIEREAFDFYESFERMEKHAGAIPYTKEEESQ